MKIYKFFLFFFLLNFSRSSAQQMYAIYDTAFVHYLNDSMPNCMRNDSLIIDSAHASTHMIAMDYGPGGYNYVIKNIDGIQFFDHVHFISINYTQITYLPHLVSDSLNDLSINWSPLRILPAFDSLPNLQNLSFIDDSLFVLPDLSRAKRLLALVVIGSAIDSVPSLDSLPLLSDLEIDRTYALHHLPNLWNNKMLLFLAVSECSLDSLPNLDSCTQLYVLDVFNNHLKSLPSLENNPRIDELICEGNLLSHLPSLDHCPELEWIAAYHNLLVDVPDLSYNTQLNALYLDSNLLIEIPDLSNLTVLQLLHVSANKLISLPMFDAHSVVDLDLSHNLITEFPVPYQSTPTNWLMEDNLINSLPDSYYGDSFSVIDISQNKFDFSNAYEMKLIDAQTAHIVPNNNIQFCCLCCEGNYNPIDYIYSPQKPFGNIDTILLDTYSDTILTIAYQQYADSYQWYQNGVAISGATDTVLHIYCATQADAGTYTCHSIGQYFNTHGFRFNYNVTEFESEPQTLIVSPTISNPNLAAIYPTVSDGNVTLKYSLPDAQSLNMKVYDMKGSLAYDFNTGILPKGEYRQLINMTGLASGSYIARIEYSSGYTRTQRFIVLH